MKILQIAPPWISIPPKGYGGTEQVIFSLCENLVKFGHDVTLFATGDSLTSAKLRYVFPESLYAAGIDWYSAFAPALHYHQAYKYARQGGFDIVHAHLSASADPVQFTFLSELNMPAIITNHSQWPYDRHEYLDGYYLRYYARNIHAVSISKYMEKEHLPEGFISEGVVCNGIETEQYQFNPEPKNYLAWIGKIVPDKGIDQAIAIAKATGEQLIFAGVVDKGVPESIKYFEEKVRPFIDGEQIKYLGEADLAQKNELLKNAKAFINPLQWEEPFGLVMLEAMACGTPVIAYAKGAVKEVVIPGKTGFWANDRKEMEALVKNDAVKSIDRADCRKHVVMNFSAEANARNYLKIYRKVITEFSSKAEQKKYLISGKYLKFNPGLDFGNI